MTKPNRTRIPDHGTMATDPGQVRLAHAKLRRLRPDLYGFGGFLLLLRDRIRASCSERICIEEQLQFGDSRAAVVVSTSPLLVAAYTDELDCVAMLRFPEEFRAEYDLSVGSRLLTVNRYKQGAVYDGDVILGPEMIERWVGFHPIIADFVSDDRGRLEERKKSIAEEEWQRTLRLGQEYLELRPGVARDGRPVHASVPASTSPVA